MVDAAVDPWLSLINRPGTSMLLSRRRQSSGFGGDGVEVEDDAAGGNGLPDVALLLLLLGCGFAGSPTSDKGRSGFALVANRPAGVWVAVTPP